MRIEPVYSTSIPQAHASPPTPHVPSYRCTLVSSHAPTWTASIGDFFKWAWDRITSLFSWCLPKKKEEPKPISPAPEVIQTVKKVRADALANKSPIPSKIRETVTEAILPLSIFWYWENDTPLVTFVANKCVTGTAFILEKKVIHYFFPEISTHWEKIGGLSIAAPVVWHCFKSLGYPLGEASFYGYPLGKILFFFGIAMNARKIYKEASDAAGQQRQMRLRQLTA